MPQFFTELIKEVLTSFLCARKLSIEICKFLTDDSINAEISHIRGLDISLADRCSREKPDFNYFFLSQQVFDEILSILDFHPALDMFASRISSKLPRYVSWKFDPYAFKVDAFSF